MRKKFDKELYDKHDTDAKVAVNKLFEGSVYKIVENPKKMGVDFLVFEGEEHIAYLEVEVKNNWKTPKFLYDDVQWPERKWKFCSLDKPTIFLMFNIDREFYLTASGVTLLKSPLQMVRNKYVKFGENFFKVPVGNVIFNDVHLSILEALK